MINIIFSNKSNLSQPKGLCALFFLEMWERFSYWGIQSLLVLYLVKYFLFSDERSYTLFGAYTALTYATSLIGGILADRLLGFKKAILLGSVLIILGNITLAMPGKALIYLGLSLIIGGTGLIKPNTASQLGTLYSKNDARRDSGFTIFYVGTNIGGILGPIVYGFISLKYGWHAAFIISAVGVLIGLLIYLTYCSLFKEFTSTNKTVSWIISLLYISMLGALWLLLIYPEWVGHLLNLVGLSVVTGFLFFISRSNLIERRAIIAIFLMVCFCLLFFACLFQCSTSLTLFIERFVNRSSFGWVIPTETFVSLQPFFVVLLAPLLAQIWQHLGEREPKAPTKIVIGLLFASLSFIFFALAAKEAIGAEKAGLTWILVGNALLSIGELCIAPPTLAAITQIAPVRLRATLIGSFYLALAFAGYIASLIAKLTTSVATSAHLKTASNYLSAYQDILILALGTSLIAFIISYYGNRVYNLITHNE